MSEAALRLSKEGAPASASADGSEVGYLEEMRAAVSRYIHPASTASRRSIRLSPAARRLREDLAATRRTFSVGAVFAETISRAQAMLKEVGVATGSVSSSDDGRDTARRLDDYAAHYTMQSARRSSPHYQGSGPNRQPSHSSEAVDTSFRGKQGARRQCGVLLESRHSPDSVFYSRIEV